MAHQLNSRPRHCLLMTRLGKPVPSMVKEIRSAVDDCCRDFNYKVVDARTKVTGRDILLKIWQLIASAPLSVGILHEETPHSTQGNIIYELGIAQALGKETVVIKSPKVEIPSDLVRTEYILFNGDFVNNFKAYLESILEQAEFYETLAGQLENNPLLSLDYLRRAFLINGDTKLRKKAKSIVAAAGLEGRAANSVERLVASF